MTFMKMDKEDTTTNKEEVVHTLTPEGDHLWKLPEDDDVDVDEVLGRPIIPGTSGVEC